MKQVTMMEIVCPGCGKNIHCFHVPSKPGKYRLRCQSNRDKQIVVCVHEDGSITFLESKV